MKKAILGAVLAGAFLLSACGASASSSVSSVSSQPPPAVSSASSEESSSTPQSEATPMEQQIYRGRIGEMTEDGDITVSQVEGYNYGQESIIFHIADETEVVLDGRALEVDAFVEVTYNGILTRSLPPQGTAISVTMIAPSAEGIVQNGTVQQVETVDDSYRITMLPLDAAGKDFADSIILMVPKDALEHLSEDELVEGLEVSAVTSGIAALSLPPQMPVVALMPYQP